MDVPFKRRETDWEPHIKFVRSDNLVVTLTAVNRLSSKFVRIFTKSQAIHANH